MAKKVKVVLNRSGVREMLRSDEMVQICREYADAAQSRLGEGHEVTCRKGKNRANAEVAAVSRKAKKENVKNNTIMKAVRG